MMFGSSLKSIPLTQTHLPLQIRCCADGQPDSWVVPKNNAGCGNVWAESDLPDSGNCNVGTFNEAEAFCADNGGKSTNKSMAGLFCQ